MEIMIKISTRNKRAALQKKSTNFAIIWQEPPMFRRQKGGLFHPGDSVLKWPVDLTIIWCCMFRACELLYSFVSGGGD